MHIIVIGGGASGIIAAIAAAKNGANVTVLERLNRIGKKILVTGNGRCNITNTDIDKKYYHTHSNIDFSYPLEKFGYEETIDFFEKLGMMRLIEGTKVYPLSEQASSVLDILRMQLECLNVEVITDAKVVDIKKGKDGFILTTQDENTYRTDRVIVATGGMAAPSLGCDTVGYNILKRLGHNITPIYPTLVHMISLERYCKMMQGSKIKGEVSIFVENELIKKEYGEVLFTEDGLSGPPIFQLSRIAAKAKEDKRKCYIKLDLFPNISFEQIISLIYKRIEQHPKKTVEQMFLGWINKRMIIAILKKARIDAVTMPCENLEYAQIEEIAKTIKDFEFKIDGTRGFKFAQATAGGVSLDEINLHTMESKKVKGLYVVGEVLDVDGDCGGYNLQWAWSTGYLAGQHASC